MNVAPRMARLGTESAFEVLARARQLERAGREIIHLEIGEPDFDTPVHIKEAAKQALDAGATHYGPSAGLPELREAIAKHVAETRGVPVAPEEVVVTPGAKPSELPLSCISPASQRICAKRSQICATPVAPTGCPLDFRPPEALMGFSPVRAVLPDSVHGPPRPRSMKPRSSIATISAMVKQSCTSANWMSRGPTPAIS